MHGHRIGYVRVSSFDQNPECQLEHVPVDRLFTDKASSENTQRPQSGGHRHRAMERGLPGTGSARFAGRWETRTKACCPTCHHWAGSTST